MPSAPESVQRFVQGVACLAGVRWAALVASDGTVVASALPTPTDSTPLAQIMLTGLATRVVAAARSCEPFVLNVELPGHDDICDVQIERLGRGYAFAVAAVGRGGGGGGSSAPASAIVFAKRPPNRA